MLDSWIVEIHNLFISARYSISIFFVVVYGSEAEWMRCEISVDHFEILPLSWVIYSLGMDKKTPMGRELNTFRRIINMQLIRSIINGI